MKRQKEKKEQLCLSLKLDVMNGKFLSPSPPLLAAPVSRLPPRLITQAKPHTRTHKIHKPSNLRPKAQAKGLCTGNTFYFSYWSNEKSSHWSQVICGAFLSHTLSHPPPPVKRQPHNKYICVVKWPLLIPRHRHHWCRNVKHTARPAMQRLLISSLPTHPTPHVLLHPSPSQHALQKHQHLIKQSISHLVCIAVPSQPCIHMPPHQHKPQHVHSNTPTHQHR